MIEILLPFDWARHLFMQNALWAILMITPLFGMLGTMVVNNRMAFFADTIGHSALTGIALGVILGLANPLAAMIFFAIIMAMVVSTVKEETHSSSDTVIGVFSATAVALGVVILSQGGGFNKYSGYLIGDLLSITPGELGLLAIVVVLFLIYWAISFNKLLLVSVHPSLARSRGINVALVDLAFGICLAVVVTVSIQWVGILIINSLLVLPAATARNITGSILAYHWVSVLIALSCGVGGLIFSYYWAPPPERPSSCSPPFVISAAFCIAGLPNKPAVWMEGGRAMPAERDFAHELQGLGKKATKARQGILAVLTESEQPLTAGDIFLRLGQSPAATSLATVYRNLKLLEAGGLVQRAGSWQGHTLYRQPCLDHQHHLICLECRKVVKIAGCPLESFSRQIGEKEGFTVTEHLLELYGYCPDCGAGKDNHHPEKNIRQQAGRNKKI